MPFGFESLAGEVRSAKKVFLRFLENTKDNVRFQKRAEEVVVGKVEDNGQVRLSVPKCASLNRFSARFRALGSADRFVA